MREIRAFSPIYLITLDSVQANEAQTIICNIVYLFYLGKFSRLRRASRCRKSAGHIGDIASV